MEKKIIMYDSDDAARFVATGISGWVSGDGFFYGNEKNSEESARYAGCTHKVCECGNIMEKIYTKCEDCRDKKTQEEYNSYEQEEWNEEGSLYSETHDLFFGSWEEVDEHLKESSASIEDLRLVICEPIYLTSVTEDFWEHDLSEDECLPDKVLQALSKFNQVLDDVGPVSYEPSKRRPILKIK